MKRLTLIAVALAIPAAFVAAQTPTPTTGGTQQYIPLVPSGGGGNGGSGGTGGTSNNSTVWYIDSARSLIVFCSQNANGGTGGGTNGQLFFCTAQTVQTLPAPIGSSGGSTGGGGGTGSGTGTGGTGTGGTGTGTTGGTGANPMGGG